MAHEAPSKSEASQFTWRRFLALVLPGQPRSSVEEAATSILNRITTILRANLNDLLDRAQDPEKAMDQYLRDMGLAIREARAQVADAAAQVTLTEADLKQSKQLVAQWQQKAEQAVASDADDLARESLRRRHDYDANVQVYEQQLVAQQDVAAKLKRDLQQLESKYAEAQRNREAMLARYRGAQAQVGIQQDLAALSLNDPNNPLSRMDEKIRQTEAQAAAANELAGESVEGRFASLASAQSDDEIEAELRGIKARNQPPELNRGTDTSSTGNDTKPT